jgi:hypothetical protein
LQTGLKAGKLLLNMKAATIATDAGSTDEGITQWVREAVGEFSKMCQHFMDHQNREILGQNPTEQQREAHRTALKWMLRVARLLYATAADPDYPDKAIASELHGRLIQLEHSWRISQAKMTAAEEAEADKLLHKIFPE